LTCADGVFGRSRKQTFTDPRLCAAVVDRLTFNAHIVETGSDSYRLAQTQENRRRTGG